MEILHAYQLYVNKSEVPVNQDALSKSDIGTKP